MPVDEDSEEENYAVGAAEDEEELCRPAVPSGGAPGRAAGGGDSRAPCPLEEEELDEPGEEDVLKAAGNLALAAWRTGEGLRRRHAPVAVPREAPGVRWSQPAGGLCLDEDDNFALGSERADGPAGAGAAAARRGEESVATWRQAFLALLVAAGAVAAAGDRRPDRGSFEALRDARYAAGVNFSATDAAEDGGLPWPLLADRSFQGRVAWSRYVDHGAFALGTVALSVAAETGAAKGKTPGRKVYEHKYLGALGLWMPLPYLPQPGSKPNTYGVGACVLAKCVCVPADLGGLLKRRGKASGQATAGQKKAGAGCLRFNGGKSAALNVVAIPTIALFALWQWPSYWPALSGHATLSLANLHRGRLWVLLSSPFSHRGWAEVFRAGLLLANTVDSFDRTGASFAVFLLLHFVGCWSMWLMRAVVWRRLIQSDPSAYYAQEWGASGGLAAQLLFLARARPEDRFSFSLYMVPIPVDLSAWQSLFAHTLVDLGTCKRDLVAEVLGQLASWAAGWLIYDAWSRHT